MPAAAARFKHNKHTSRMTEKEKRQEANLARCHYLDVVVPSSLLNDTSGGESSVLIEIDPSHGKKLDFEGATGAIGRFEADEDASKFMSSSKPYRAAPSVSIGLASLMSVPDSRVLLLALTLAVTLDLKGYQYEGRIHPGPTAMVLAVKGESLRVDVMTDEFVTLTKTSDLIAKLDAVVQGNTQGYQVVEEDANRKNDHGSKVSTSSGNGMKAEVSSQKIDGRVGTKKRKFQSRKAKK